MVFRQLLIGPELPHVDNDYDIIMVIEHKGRKLSLKRALDRVELYGNPRQPVELWLWRNYPSSMCLGIYKRCNIVKVIKANLHLDMNVSNFRFRNLYTDEIILCHTTNEIGGHKCGGCRVFYSYAECIEAIGQMEIRPFVQWWDCYGRYNHQIA